MKREFLQGLQVGENPLPKEVIDAIMAENGRDIENVKSRYADYETLKTQLAQAEDAAGAAEAAKAWEEKYNQAVETHKTQIAQMAFEKMLGRWVCMCPWNQVCSGNAALVNPGC